MLYLQNRLADSALLSFPSSSLLDYQSLLQVAVDLEGKREIGLEDFINLSKVRFNFSCEQAELYFQTYLVLFNNDGEGYEELYNGWKVATLPFILFLYNQLYLSPGLSSTSSMKVDSEFPSIKEESHDPLGGLVFTSHYSSRASTASLDDMDTDDLPNSKIFPATILEKRYKLAAFWRSSVKKWLTLAHVVLYGSAADGNMGISSTIHGRENILIQDLKALELFFTPVSPRKDSAEYSSVKARFHHWMRTREESIHNPSWTSESMKFSSSLDKSASFFRVDLCLLITDLVLELNITENHNGLALSMESLGMIFQWSIMERPAVYESLEISPYGVPLTSEVASHQILSDIDIPEVLISRRRGIIAAIHPHFIKGQSVVLHRLQNCEIYLVGPIESLIISKCKNCTIFAGVVKGMVNVRSSSKITLTSCCAGLVFSFEEQSALKAIGGSVAFISTRTRPVLEVGDNCVVDSSSVLFAPCNSWYKGILTDLAKVGHDLNRNLWNQPFTVISSEALLMPNQFIGMVPLTQFFLNEIPFDIHTTEVITTYKEIELRSFLSALPAKYSSWIKGFSEYQNSLQGIMKKASERSPAFNRNVQIQLETWAENSKLNTLPFMTKSKSYLLEILAHPPK